MTSPEFVQPIVLARSGCHEDAVRCAAEASVAAFDACPDLPEWGLWLSGPFTKTVRRARPAEYEKARACGAAAEVGHGDARALGFRPVPADALPRPIGRLQVSGTELPRRGWPNPNPDCRLLVAVNETLTMSTGKTAAQAAHGLFAARLHAGRPLPPAAFIGVDRDRFDDLAARAIIVIRDAGRTEIAPHSPTIAVTLN